MRGIRREWTRDGWNSVRGRNYEAETWAFARIAEYAPKQLRRYGKLDSTMESDMIIFISELLAVVALAAQHGYLGGLEL